MTVIFSDVDSMYLEAKGHAGGGPEGYDIICAGVSALTMALVNMLNEEQDKGRLQAEWDMRPGEIKIRAKPLKPIYTRMARDYFRVIDMGLRAMADNYPDNVKYEGG